MPRNTAQTPLAWIIPIMAVATMMIACGAPHLEVYGPIPIHGPPSYALEITSQTLQSVTIAAHAGLPEVVILDVPKLFEAALAQTRTPSQLVIHLTVQSIDFDATRPREEVLASGFGGTIIRTHGAGRIDVHAAPRMPHYVRIKFSAELGASSLRKVTGTVSGEISVGASQDAMRAAIGSAIDEVLIMVERALASHETV